MQCYACNDFSIQIFLMGKSAYLQWFPKAKGIAVPRNLKDEITRKVLTRCKRVCTSLVSKNLYTNDCRFRVLHNVYQLTIEMCPRGMVDVDAWGLVSGLLFTLCLDDCRLSSGSYGRQCDVSTVVWGHLVSLCSIYIWSTHLLQWLIACWPYCVITGS